MPINLQNGACRRRRGIIKLRTYRLDLQISGRNDLLFIAVLDIPQLVTARSCRQGDGNHTVLAVAGVGIGHLLGGFHAGFGNGQIIVFTSRPLPFDLEDTTRGGRGVKFECGLHRLDQQVACGKDNLVAAVEDIAHLISARRGRHFDLCNAVLAVPDVGIGDFRTGLAAGFGNGDVIAAAADLPCRAGPSYGQRAAGLGRVCKIDRGGNRQNLQLLRRQHPVAVPVQHITQFIGAGVSRGDQLCGVVFTVPGIGIGDFRTGIAADFGNGDVITATADLFVRPFPDNLEGFTHFDCIGGCQAGFDFAYLNGVAGQNFGIGKGILKPHLIGAGFGGGGHCRLGVGVLVGVKIGGVIVRTVAGFGHRNDIALVGGRFPFHIENGPDRHLVRRGDVKGKLGNLDRLARQNIAVPCRGLIA